MSKTNNEDAVVSEQFTNLGPRFQEKVLKSLIHDKTWATQFLEVFEVDECLEQAAPKFIANRYVKHYKNYKEFPSIDLLGSMIKEDLSQDRDSLLRAQCLGLLTRLSDLQDAGDLSWVKEKAFDFCRQQLLKKALTKSVDLILTDKYETVVDVMKSAISAGMPSSPGHDYNNDMSSRYSITARNTISTGLGELDARKVLNGGLGEGEVGIVIAPTGCHSKGTMILMYDGSIKAVEDVMVGDLLMGPDSKPRTVLSLVNGTDQMYQISPTKGEPFVVNENHILSLRHTTTGVITNLTVKKWLNQTTTFKHEYKLYRSGEIVFDENSFVPLPVPPYILGMMLSDGYAHSNRVELTSADNEVVKEWTDYAKTVSCGISKHPKVANSKAVGYYLTNGGSHKNSVVTKLKNLRLIDTNSTTKFIPPIYKTSSVDNRRELIAGLIDTDGSLSANCFDYVSKSKQLADDVAFVCRSIGLAAYVSETYKQCQTGAGGMYYRVTISGNTDKIPCRIGRKQPSTRKQKKNVLNTGFSVEKDGIDNYYGFVLNSDHLYLLNDFTVIHNCGKSHFLVAMGANAVRQGKNVLHFTLEMSEKLIGIRYDSNFSGIPTNDCYDNQDQLKKVLEESSAKFGRLWIKEYPTRSATAATLKNFVEKTTFKHGIKPNLIIVDYAGIMRSSERFDLPRLELRTIIQELKLLAKELTVPLWTALQSNKEGAKSEIIDTTNASEGYGQGAEADLVLGFQRTNAQKSTGYGSLYVAKNRNGLDGLLWQVHADTGTSTFKILTQQEVGGQTSDVDDLPSSTGFKSHTLKDFREATNKLKDKYLLGNSDSTYSNRRQ